MPNPGPSTTVTQDVVAVMAVSNAPTLGGTQQGTNMLRLLAVGRNVNVNAVGDQAIMPVINATSLSVSAVIFTNASISLTTAAAGIFTQPSAGGVTIVANAALATMTTPSVVSARTVASTAMVNGSTFPNLYLNVGTAQGAAATMDVFVYGYDLS